MIYSSFKDFAVPVHFINNNDDEDESNLPLSQRILNKYELTNNAKDYILVKDVEILGFDKIKIGKALEAMGIEKKKSSMRNDTRNKTIYVGIKKKIQDDTDIEELDDEDD